jgi:hypothetical protein
MIRAVCYRHSLRFAGVLAARYGCRERPIFFSRVTENGPGGGAPRPSTQVFSPELGVCGAFRGAKSLLPGAYLVPFGFTAWTCGPDF